MGRLEIDKKNQIFFCELRLKHASLVRWQQPAWFRGRILSLMSQFERYKVLRINFLVKLVEEERHRSARGTFHECLVAERATAR